MYYVYMLKCVDGSIYTGSTSDIKKRLKEHFTKSPKCAKYTKSHPPKEIAAVWSCDTKSEGNKVEYYIKTLTRAQKEVLYQKNEAPESILEKLDGIVLSRISKKDLKDFIDFL